MIGLGLAIPQVAVRGVGGGAAPPAFDYYTDFSEYTTGVQPIDWTERFNTATWTVGEDAGATGGKVMNYTRATAERVMLSWDDIDGDAGRVDVRITARVRMIDGDAQPLMMGRASEPGGNTQGYRLGINRASSRIEALKYVAGSTTILATQAFSTSLSTWYTIKAEISGTDLRLKVWADETESEPASWQIETTDGDITAAGWVGFFSFNPDDYETDWVGIDTI